MKIHILILFILNISVCGKSIAGQDVVSLLFSANGQFKMLTMDSAPGSLMNKAQFDSCLSIKDIKNGYLMLNCGLLTVSYQVAKFQRKDRGFLLVIIKDGVSVETRWFLKKVNGT